MLYFAYGHDLNHRSLVEWCDLNDRRAPMPRPMVAAVAVNQRLAFPVFSNYWHGGVAALLPEPGKRVSGALIDLPPNHLELLAEFNDRRLDPSGKEIGRSKLAEISVEPYGKKTDEARIQAITFIPTAPETGHVPPTRLYIDRMIEAVLDLELSAMWVMHLRSCLMGPEETSRFFPGVSTGAGAERADEGQSRRAITDAPKSMAGDLHRAVRSGNASLRAV